METPREQTLKTADIFLQAMAETTAKLAEAEALAEAELEAVRTRHTAKIQGLKSAFENIEKNLLAMMKMRCDEIFEGIDQVDLQHGLLLHGWADKVKIPRDAVEKIEKQGWEEALKRAVTVNRAVVETWPVERLTLIGVEKKTVEEFSYEIKEGPKA